MTFKNSVLELNIESPSKPAFGWSQIVSLVSALSMVRCPYHYKYFNKVVGNWQTPSNTVIQVAPLNFSLLLHNLQHCSHALVYTIHTQYTPAVAEVVLLELLDMCIFLHCLLPERDQ